MWSPPATQFGWHETLNTIKKPQGALLLGYYFKWKQMNWQYNLFIIVSLLSEFRFTESKALENVNAEVHLVPLSLWLLKIQYTDTLTFCRVLTHLYKHWSSSAAVVRKQVQVGSISVRNHSQHMWHTCLKGAFIYATPPKTREDEDEVKRELRTPKTKWWPG